jgi:hypothetical protein
MPIFFEKRPRGEGSVLTIYGTKDEFARFADSLKDRVALQDLYRKPESNLRLPNLKSSSFDEVEVLVVSEKEALNLQRSVRRKKMLIFALWIVFITVTICVLLFAPKLG